LGLISTELVEAADHKMSAFATKLTVTNKLFALCRSGYAFALGDDWIVPSADYRAAVLDLPAAMARCASKSFATPQSCFISIKVVAVGNNRDQTFTVSTRNLLDSLLWSGFAGEKNAEGASGPRRGLTSQSSALLVR